MTEDPKEPIKETPQASAPQDVQWDNRPPEMGIVANSANPPKDLTFTIVNPRRIDKDE